MFVVAHADIGGVLKNYGTFPEIKHISELQRYDYEGGEPDSKEVRLIVKVEFASGSPLVLRFKNEADVTLGGVEKQCRFADRLRKNGILTPYQYESNGAFAKQCQINGYDVIITVEEFVEHEIKAVDPAIAWKTGEVLAKMHNISETNDLHVPNKVLFDPFSANDLFDFRSFASLEPLIGKYEKPLFDQIMKRYHAYMDLLTPLARQPSYAVQGDISNCNLYQDPSGEIGVFDFNRCGDNRLFCDAVMQAVFEARLMDYPDGAVEDIGAKTLVSFLRGYDSVRHFSEEQQSWYPYLYALIDGFWSSDIRWDDNSLTNALHRGDAEGAQKWLETIWQRLEHMETMNLSG